MTVTTYPKNNSGIAKHYDKLRLWQAGDTRTHQIAELAFCINLSCLKNGCCPKICGLQRERTEYDSTSIPENKSGIAKHYDTPILLRACNTRKI